MALAATAAIQYKGDWKAFEKFLDYKWGKELRDEINRATKKSCLYIISEVRRRIHNREYTENKPSTIRAKSSARTGGGTQSDTPLIDQGTMVRALSFNMVAQMSYLVGFIKDQKTTDGRSTLFEVIPALHDGATITQSVKGKTRIIRIPPREFLKNVWEDPKVIAIVNKNWEFAIGKVLKKYGKWDGR